MYLFLFVCVLLWTVSRQKTGLRRHFEL